jgi:hypothetical protein
MKIGDLVRVRNIHEGMNADHVQPGFLLRIQEKASADMYYIIVMEGPYMGVEHWITSKNLEMIG